MPRKAKDVFASYKFGGPVKVKPDNTYSVDYGSAFRQGINKSVRQLGGALKGATLGGGVAKGIKKVKKY